MNSLHEQSAAMILCSALNTDDHSLTDEVDFVVVVGVDVLVDLVADVVVLVFLIVVVLCLGRSLAAATVIAVVGMG